MRNFYRVGNTNDEQGLWYNKAGNFTGLIHTKFNFCANSKLPMPYDENIVGYLSVANTIVDLYFWFPLNDLKRLNEHGLFLFEYEASDYRRYANHWIINQETSVPTKIYVHNPEVTPSTNLQIIKAYENTTN